VKLADYVADRLAKQGVRDVFMVTGGFAMHLNAAFARAEGLTVTCFHHEQAAAMAADGYYRIANRPAVVNVTAGPGSTNALTGVLGAWDDSTGMIVVSGQPRRELLTPTTGLPLRQFGEQELDIVEMVKGITKYAWQVLDPGTIRYHLERAIYLAHHGRPGPVWLDIPLDVQSADIDPEILVGYDENEDLAATIGSNDAGRRADEVATLLRDAQRPVLFVGPDVHAAGATTALRQLVERLQVPVVAAINGTDLLDWRDPCFVGPSGLIGSRAGNLAVQNADLVVVLGTRLPIGMTGYEAAAWAPGAHVVMVDIDAAEMSKPTLHVESPIHLEVGGFIAELLAAVAEPSDGRHAAWLTWCQERRDRYPVVLAEYWECDQPINPYVLFPSVFDGIADDAVVVTGNAWAGNGGFQAGKPRVSQRVFASIGCGSMGHDLPAAIGCALADPRRMIACIPGDGSLQMNIQELQTIVHYRLPIKIFVLANGGYGSIRQSQRRFYPDALIGFDPTNGVSFPDLAKLAPAYDLPFRRIDRLAELAAGIEWAAQLDGPVLVEVLVDADQEYAPKSATKQLSDGSFVSSPLEDMAPFLPEDETFANLGPSRGELRELLEAYRPS